MYRLPFIFVSLFSVLHLYGQTDFAAVRKLADNTKEQNAIIGESVTTISFSFDKGTQHVQATETSEIQCISLKPSDLITFGIHYDDNITITKAKSPGNTVEKTCGNYRPDWIFHSDDKLCTYSIFFKDAGEIKSFLYEKSYSDVRYLTSSYFSNRYPTLKSIIRIEVPEGLNIECTDYNTADYTFKVSRKTDPKSKITTLEYQCENIPGFDAEEKKTPRFSFFYPHLLIQPKSYQARDGKEEIFGNLNDFYQWSLNLAKETSNVIPTLKPFTEKLIEGKVSDLEKIKTIYYWVQDNIRYLAFEGGLQGYVPEDAEKVFTQKFSDCKGKANLLKTMLCLCGFDARLTWIGTDDVRYDFSTPTLASCDHMVCALFFKGNHYILDATCNYLPFPRVPEYIQGRQALIENGNHFILDTLGVEDPAQNQAYLKNHLSLANNDLQGSVSFLFNGEMKSRLLQKLNNTRVDEQPKLLEKIVTREDPKVSAKNITSSDIQNREAPLEIKADILVKGNVVSFENDLYITPDPYDDLSDLTIKADRQFPLDISQKINRKTETILELSAGYRIQKIPEGKSFSNELLRFNVRFSSNGKTITYTKEIQTVAKIITKQQFQAWNDALKMLKRTCSQPIVITKLLQ